VTRSDEISIGLRLASLSLSYTHLYIFSDSSCHVVFFSRIFLRFWHSLHISSHYMVFVVSSFVLLKFLCFLEYWNILLRFCA
jgi:ABC-type multidrug transport system permease subunit